MRRGNISSTDSVRTPEIIIKYIKTILKSETIHDVVPFNEKFDKHKDIDALTINWKPKTWLNPPYSTASRFVKKACSECLRGIESVVFVKDQILTTKYFSEHSNGVHIYFIPFKLTFPGYKKQCGFGNVLLHFRPNCSQQTWSIAKF